METKVIRIEIKFTRWALAILLGSLMLVGLMIVGDVSAQDSGPSSDYPPLPSGVEVVDTEETVALETLATANNVAPMISYQGRLTDPNGNPLNGVYDMTFQFWDAETGGDTVGGAINKTDVTVENGLFNVELNVNSSDFNGQALWLEITVEGETLAPTQRIMPAPYALSLRPGAIISDTSSYVRFNKFDLHGMITSKIAVYGKTDSGAVFQYGVWGEGGSAGVYGYSENGYGVYASGGASSTALYADGDVQQNPVGNGLVKAAVSALCTDTLPEIDRSFNNLGPTEITIVEGEMIGECYIDFGYDISERFWSVTPDSPVLASSCGLNNSNHNQLRCRSYTHSGTNVPVHIIVLIY